MLSIFYLTLFLFNASKLITYFTSSGRDFNNLIGVFGGRDHLFPYRTEKLSLPAQMVLEQIRESMPVPIISGAMRFIYNLLFRNV